MTSTLAMAEAVDPVTDNQTASAITRSMQKVEAALLLDRRPPTK